MTSDPRQRVAVQLKILTPVGIPIRNELSMKKPSTTSGIGAVNRWWAQTSVDRKAITIVDAAIALYPKMGFRANTGRTSEMIPKPGRIMMYTSGCPKNQNRFSHSTGDPWLVGS